MNQCKNCKFCYPLKTCEFKADVKKYVCINNSEAYTHPPFNSPEIPDINVCSCKYYDEAINKQNGSNTRR